jgi:hypothetical protein
MTPTPMPSLRRLSPAESHDVRFGAGVNVGPFDKC